MRSSAGRQGHFLRLGVESKLKILEKNKVDMTLKLELKPSSTTLDIWLKVKLRLKVTHRINKCKKIHH